MRETTLAVLAGGAGSRMGTPKSKLMVRGLPILEYLLRQYEWDGPTLLVTAPGFERPAGAERFDREVCDPVAGLGPLRGVLTALEAAQTEIVVVATVDMPNVRQEHLESTAHEMSQRPELFGVMYARPDIEPFPSAFRRAAIQTIERQLANHQRSMHRLLQRPEFATIDAPAHWPGDVWMNLNTPQDFELFIRGLR